VAAPAARPARRAARRPRRWAAARRRPRPANSRGRRTRRGRRAGSPFSTATTSALGITFRLSPRRRLYSPRTAASTTR
jgi:hypothetical protein